MRPAGKQTPQIEGNATMLKNATSIAFVGRVRGCGFCLATKCAVRRIRNASGAESESFYALQCSARLSYRSIKRMRHKSKQICPHIKPKFDLIKKLPFKTTEMRSMILLGARCR